MVYSLCVNNKTYKTTSEILHGREEHFSQLYAPSTDKHFDAVFKERTEEKLKEYISLNINESDSCFAMNSEIKANEVDLGCRELKKNVAGGKDHLLYEHIIYGGEILKTHIAWLFTLMLTHGEVPSNMKHGLVITLLKHGKKNKSDPNNYRGIVLLPVIYKLFEKVTLKRIISAMEKNTESFPDPLQGAYQKQLSSLNTSLILTETIKYNTERGSKVFSYFLDTVKAFDYV